LAGKQQIAGVTGRKRVAARGGRGGREGERETHNMQHSLCSPVRAAGEERKAVDKGGKAGVERERCWRRKEEAVTKREKEMERASTLRLRMKTCPAQLGQSGWGL